MTNIIRACPYVAGIDSVGMRSLKGYHTELTDKQIEKIDGVDCYMITRDVTSDSHPAYTGEKRFVDTAGRVEKFQKKFSRVRSR